MHERQYQMIKRGLELYPSIQKLERLLGHNLNINKDIIEIRVKCAIESQFNEFNINILLPKEDEVDIRKLMMDSVYRNPPFDPGEKEKGFRDALIAETFLQLVSNSPVTPKICRIALLSSDDLLCNTIKDRTKDKTNVRIVKTLEELKGLINTLFAEISEDFVNKIQQQATSYFFTLGEEDTLYYKENIRSKIIEKFENRLQELPEGADKRQNGKWYIFPPRFSKRIIKEFFGLVKSVLIQQLIKITD